MSEVNTYNISIHQGESWTMTLTVKDENGTAKNITGYSGKMQIRDMPGGTVYEELATTPGSGMTINGAYGEVELNLSAAETAALNLRNGVYDIYIKSGSDTVTYLLKGALTVHARVTQ